MLSVLAVDGVALIPKTISNATITPRSLYERSAVEWTIFDGDEHLKTCGHEL